MTIRRQGSCNRPNKVLIVAALLAMTVQIIPSPGTYAIASMAAKASEMQMPILEKLDDSGATTGDAHTEAAPIVPADLSPMTLNDASASGGSSDTTTTTASDGTKVLKSTVTTTDFVPKGLLNRDKDNAALAAPVSIKADRGDDATKILKQANEEALGPTALSDQDKAQTISAAERAELSDLWDATLQRSPDIHFITEKLMPTSNPSKTAGMMMHLMTAALFAGMGAVSMISPSPMTYAGINSGGSMVAQALNGIDKKRDKKARLDQSQMIQLFTIMRSTAEKMVDNYREYKKNLKLFMVASSDLADLQNISRNSPTENPAIALEKEATLRRAQREVDAQSDEVGRYRQALVDQAGGEAVAKLDKQLTEELKLLDPTVAVDPKAIPQTDSDPSQKTLSQIIKDKVQTQAQAKVAKADASPEKPATDGNAQTQTAAKPSVNPL